MGQVTRAPGAQSLPVHAPPCGWDSSQLCCCGWRVPSSRSGVSGDAGLGTGAAPPARAAAEPLALLVPKGHPGPAGRGPSRSVAGEPPGLCSSVRNGGPPPRSLHTLTTLQLQKASVEQDPRAQAGEGSSHRREAGRATLREPVLRGWPCAGTLPSTWLGRLTAAFPHPLSVGAHLTDEINSKRLSTLLKVDSKYIAGLCLLRAQQGSGPPSSRMEIVTDTQITLESGDPPARALGQAVTVGDGKTNDLLLRVLQNWAGDPLFLQEWIVLAKDSETQNQNGTP